MITKQKIVGPGDTNYGKNKKHKSIIKIDNMIQGNFLIKKDIHTSSFEDLRKAFEAGQQQARAEWDNETSRTIGYYNADADVTFESWLKENYLNIE